MFGHRNRVSATSSAGKRGVRAKMGIADVPAKCDRVRPRIIRKQIAADLPRCPRCKFRLVRYRSIKRRAAHPPARAYKCLLCKKLFLDDYVTKDRARNPTNPLCPRCGERTRRSGFPRARILWKGRRRKLTRFQCTDCDISFTEKTIGKYLPTPKPKPVQPPRRPEFSEERSYTSSALSWSSW
jgi:transposase-like protein